MAEATLDPPTVSCGNCHFTSALEGSFVIHDDRLVFKVAADPQPRRGPDLTSCGECGASFTAVSWDWGRNRIAPDAHARIADGAIKAREREWADWQKEHGQLH